MSNVSLTRLRVSLAFFCVAVLCDPVIKAQNDLDSTDKRLCGRSSCKELDQVLRAAVSSATQELETARLHLRRHEVHTKGPISRFVGHVKHALAKMKNAIKHDEPRTLETPESEQSKQSDDQLISVYRAPAFRHLLLSTRKILDEGLMKNADLGPLRSSVQSRFPVSPPVEKIRGKDYVEAESGDLFLDQTVKSYLNDTLNNGPGPVKLHFTSKPVTGAYVVLKDSPYSTVTEGWIDGLPRGRYTYEVKRDGFKTGIGQLDCAYDPRKDVDCYLQSPTGSQPTICVFTGDRK